MYRKNTAEGRSGKSFMSVLGPFLAVGIALASALVAAPVCAQDHWVAVWATAPQPTTEQSRLPAELTNDVTLRQILRLSGGGAHLRLRLSNSYGATPLRLDSVHLAHALSPAGSVIDAASDRVVRFGGRTEVIIPAGATYLSDPVDLPTQALASIAVSLHLVDMPEQQTTHIASHATSYAVAGNHAGDTQIIGNSFEHWFLLQGIDAQAPASTVAVVAFGDSITDGSWSTTNANQRWPDVLAERLQANPAMQRVTVINEGIGGNRLRRDGVGSNGLARFDRDVLSQPGARTVIVLEGVNDLGSISRDGPVTPEIRAETVRGVIDAYRQIIERAHARGFRVIGATITPFGGTKSYRSDADADADRREVNDWIRQPGHFDAVIDFDKVVRDPAHPERLLPTYDCGDHLHFSPAGYRAMGEAVPLDALVR